MLQNGCNRRKSQCTKKSCIFIYEKGEGIDKNIEHAIYWYKNVLENGSRELKYSFKSKKVINFTLDLLFCCIILFDIFS